MGQAAQILLVLLLASCLATVLPQNFSRWPPQQPSPEAMLVQLRAAVSRNPGSQTYAFKPEAGWQRLHPSWIMRQACQYGTLPGTWLPEMQSVVLDRDGHNGSIIAYSHYESTFDGKLDLNISNVTHGHGWQTFEPSCQLADHLHEYLNLRRPQLPEAQRPISVLLLGDSLERETLHWYSSILEQTHNGTEQWNELQQRSGWTYTMDVKSADPGNGLNVHVALIHGLSTNDVWLKGFGYDLPPADGLSAHQGPRWVEKHAPKLPKDVDIIRVGSAYWDLKFFIEPMVEEKAVGVPPDMLMLPKEAVLKYQAAMVDTLLAVRRHWPHALVVWRTAPQVKTTLEDGLPTVPPDISDAWRYKMRLAQLNNAARHVAHRMRVPILDLDMIGQGLTPHQLDRDWHHPRDWFSMVGLNILLNMAIQFRQYNTSCCNRE